MLDRQLLKAFLPTEGKETFTQIGIYAASYKLTMFISLFTQAYRYAAEPFFFQKSGDRDAPPVYARMTLIFGCAGLIGIMAIMCALPLLSWFVGPEGSKYREGLRVVPVLLIANVFLGIYYSISNWYRIIDKTKMGAWISLAGLAITLIINIAFIPAYGYMASAWATLFCYLGMCVICYVIGQKYYPVPYPVGRFFIYSLGALLFTLLALRTETLGAFQWLFKLLIIGAFAWIIWWYEKRAGTLSTEKS
jgi:O-antigen/teichoic acid export membrane protein